jgi:putative DNA primase/helicase
LKESIMKPNIDSMKRFKQALHRRAEVTFQIFSKEVDGNSQSEIIHGRLTPTLLRKLKTLSLNGATVTMMINRGDLKGRKATNVTKVIAVFVDSDGTCKLSTLKSAPIMPHLIVKTSPGHYHAYWLLKGMPLTEFKPVQISLARMFNTDASVNDLPRVMRLPGTINWSHAKPFLVKEIDRAVDLKPISWDTFQKKMGLFTLNDPYRDKTGAAVAGKSDLISRIEDALPKIPANDRQIWLQVGMAIHSELPNEKGYGLWTKWSNDGSEKYDEIDQRRTWNNFNASRGVGIGTLFHLATKAPVYASETPSVVAGDELELAEMFAAKNREQLRYVESEQKWYAWDGMTWRKGNTAAHQLAREFGKAHAVAMASMNVQGQGLRSLTGLRNMLGYACTLPEIQAKTTDFDSNPDLLAVRNGVIHLPTGNFRLATAADMVTRTADVEFDKNADSPRWIQFIEEITSGSTELAQFLQLAIGYTLYGHNKEQIFLILIGMGANGKGVFMRTIYRLLDEYALTLPGAVLNRAYATASGASPAIAKIDKRRYLMCTEVPKRPLDEAFVKALSGSDPLSARKLYTDQTEFQPQGKLWLSVNEMPPVSFDDDAMWRRLVPIPLKRQFRGANRDPNLEDALCKELSGILNWALEGASRYASTGLKLCKASRVLRLRLRKGDNETEGFHSEEDEAL